MNKIKNNLDKIVISLAIIASILVVYGSFKRYNTYEKTFYNVYNNGAYINTINRNHLPDNKQCVWVGNDFYCDNLIFKRIK